MNEYSYSTKYTWRIQNFSTTDTDHLYSDVFTGGPGHKWQIKLYPKGDKKDGDLSIYLCVADSATLPTGWTRRVKFSLSVVSEVKEKTVKRETENNFRVMMTPFGYSQFMTFDKLHDIFSRFLVNDTCTVRAEVWFNEEQQKGKPDTKEAEQDVMSKVRGPADSVSGDDALLKQCMERLNAVKAVVSVRDYKDFIKTLVESRGTCVAFMSVPDEMVADLVKQG